MARFGGLYRCGRVTLNKNKNILSLEEANFSTKNGSFLYKDGMWPQTKTNSSDLSTTYYMPIRYLSSGPERKNFIASIYDNIRQDISKNKEMKENLKKFREEASKLEQSEALQKARVKYQSIESETVKGSEVLKKGFDSLHEKLKETLSEAEKTELAKKSKMIADELSQTAGKAASSISKGGEQLSQTKVFKSVREGVKAVKEEIDDAALVRATMYKKPEKLRYREEHGFHTSAQQVFEANLDSTGVELHKDSKWSESWQNFKDNNQYVNKMFDLKTKYDESDNIAIRASRTITDKFTQLFGSLLSRTEMSDVLTEIVKMDPNFTKEEFIADCQTDIIPNVLEAMTQGNLEILEDWCHEAAFNLIAQPMREAFKRGCTLDCAVLDINQIDIVGGRILENGPVLFISFNAQQIMCVRDTLNAVIEGDPNKIMKVGHIWALCRDQTILDPKAAWRIADISSSPAEQFI